MCTAACLGQCRADINGLDLVASLLLVAQWDSVADNDAGTPLAKSCSRGRLNPFKARWMYIPLQAAAVQVLNCLSGKNTVHNDGVDFEGAVLHHGLGGLGESAAGVGHVVDDDGNLVLDITDKDHARDFVGTGTFLVNEGELQVEAIGNGSGAREDSS